MTVATPEVVSFHRDLVRIRSVSGEEGPIAEHLREFLASRGHKPRVHGRNVICERGEGPRGLLLNTHSDTVPPSGSWTLDPFEGRVQEGRTYGLGASDAKASLAAMVFAFLESEPAGGRVTLAITCDEETGGEGLEKIAGELPPFEAAIIGEPTALSVCPAQRGMLKLELRARGKSAHAARPQEGENAIYKAMADVARLRDLHFEATEGLLGRSTLAVTMVAGGTRSNVIPDECRLTLDIRTNRVDSNEAVLARIRGLVESEVVVKSNRFHPVMTFLDARVVTACLSAAGGREPAGFGGLSDMAWVRHVPAVVWGPGVPAVSHTADEWVSHGEIERAAVAYRDAIAHYLSGES